MAALWLHGEVERRSLQMQLAQMETLHAAPGADAGVAAPAEAPAAAPASVAARPPVALVAPTGPVVVSVPYGEQPLAGSRVERLRAVLNQLAQSGFQGSVEVQTLPGRSAWPATRLTATPWRRRPPPSISAN